MVKVEPTMDPSSSNVKVRLVQTFSVNELLAKQPEDSVPVEASNQNPTNQGQQQQDKPKPVTRTVSYLGLFKYAHTSEIIFMIIGSIGAVGYGTSSSSSVDSGIALC